MPNFYDPESVAVPSGHWIGDTLVQDGMDAIDVIRPSDGKVHAQLPVADAAIVDRAVQAARAAAPAWAAMKPRERGRLLIRFGNAVAAEAERIGQLESVVSSRVQSEAGAIDVMTGADYLRFYGEYCDKLEGGITASGPDTLSLVTREAYGVVGIITPWNFPVILSTWKIAPALAAGNTVVLKPSELTPYSMIRIAEIALEVGIPAGVLNIVQGGASAGQALATHPDVSYVSFTGSSAVGGRIMGDVGQSGLKPVSLELGGKGAQLVFGDCGDLETVADHITWGITRNAGQLCYAGSRLIAHRTVVDKLTDLVAQRMADLRAGATWQSETTLAPIISGRQVNRMQDIVDRAVKAGGDLLCGGSAFQSDGGMFFSPTMLVGIKAGMEAYEEEIFGPVLTVESFDSFEEGVALSKHSRYGLSASIFTQDMRKSMAAARNIGAGTVWLNRWGRTAEMMTSPFGGFGQSGFGKEAGRQGIEGFTKQKAIWIDFNEQADLAHVSGPAS